MRKIFQEFNLNSIIEGSDTNFREIELRQIRLIDAAKITQLYEAMVEEEARPELLKSGLDVEAIRSEIKVLLIPAFELQIDLQQKHLALERKQAAVRERYQELREEMEPVYQSLEAFLHDASAARLQGDYEGVIKVRGMLRTMSRGYASGS